MSEEEINKEKENKENKEPKQINNNIDTKKDITENVEDDFDKEDANFDTMDFNMNPFNNSNDLTNKDKRKESEEFFLYQKEDNKIKLSNDNNNNDNFKLNIKPNPSNNSQLNSIQQNFGTNSNNNNFFINFNNLNNNNNYTNFNVPQNNNIYNNSSLNNIGYNNNTNNSINNNLYNIGYDIKATPFTPKNNNIGINPNINNININNSNFLATKGRQSWVCPFCQNFNSKSEQLCNRCGNINIDFSEKNFSSNNLPFVFPFENNYPPFSPVNNNPGSLQNNYIANSYMDQLQYQNEKYLFSKNDKKKKKTKKNTNQKNKEKRPFDWICNRCNNLNYSFRTFCNICNLPKSQNVFYNSSMRNSK